MGKHTAPVDFDLIPTSLKAEVPTSHRAHRVRLEEQVTTPIDLPFMPPVPSSLHLGDEGEGILPFATAKPSPLSELAAGFGYGDAAAPRYRRGGAR